MIPYGRQWIDEADRRAVEAVLKSDFLTQGKQVPAFEAALAGRCAAGHGVAVNSATSALHIACLALELGPGDLFWTSPNTFVATANAARLCSADVGFVDIDPDTANMSVPALAEKLRTAKKTGRLPKIIAPVHFAGQPCDMASIGALAREYGVRVIEDASHAVGAQDTDGPVGRCRHGDITVFSFHPVKIITTGEGGMAMTNDAELARRMRLLRSHGVTREPEELTTPPQGSWVYEQIMLGLNYRMTEIAAALGLAQLERLDDFLSRRRLLADRYDRLLADLPVRPLRRMSGIRSAWHLYVIHLKEPSSRRRVFEALRKAGIGVQVHYIPVHTQPYYRALGFRTGDFPAAEAYYDGAISLPLFPALTDEEQDGVIAELKRILGP
jgi:UDP-4-amino-4,6-dideoxy-N-acetyl-beta-L-altrosamine transaminase